MNLLVLRCINKPKIVHQVRVPYQKHQIQSIVNIFIIVCALHKGHHYVHLTE